MSNEPGIPQGVSIIPLKRLNSGTLDKAVIEKHPPFARACKNPLRLRPAWLEDKPGALVVPGSNPGGPTNSSLLAWLHR